jgi:peptidoglycan/xylan/chitin deacetylase (PgdA/CDA1 family)
VRRGRAGSGALASATMRSVVLSLGLASLVGCASGSGSPPGPAGGAGSAETSGASGDGAVETAGTGGGAGSGGSSGALATPSSGGTSAGSSGAGGSSPSEPEAAASPECASGGFAWPEGKKAAVVLTYDDGLPSQLSNAVPALERHGLTATFFLSENFAGFAERKAEYQALHQKGFELAAHTVRHPCVGLTPELGSLDRAAIEKELDDNVATLRALGVTGPLTFAYPCGNTEYGTPPTSYVPLIEARFSAARGVNCCALPASSVNLYDVNTYWPPSDATEATITAPVDEAVANGTFLVYGFHAVGDSPGEWSAVPQVAHDALVAYLAEKSDVWVTTFGAAADYVKRCR